MAIKHAKAKIYQIFIFLNLNAPIKHAKAKMDLDSSSTLIYGLASSNVYILASSNVIYLLVS